MASEGPNSPTSVTGNSGIGSVDWVNPGNAEVEDGNFATISLDENASYYLWCITFGYSIPAGSVIDGVFLEYDAYEAYVSGGRAANVRLIKGGSLTGSQKSNISIDSSDHDRYREAGSSSDMWGATLTASDVNASGFGVAFWFECFGSPSITGYNFDHVRLTVYFTPPLGRSQCVTI